MVNGIVTGIRPTGISVVAMSLLNNQKNSKKLVFVTSEGTLWECNSISLLAYLKRRIEVTPKKSKGFISKVRSFEKFHFKRILMFMQIAYDYYLFKNEIRILDKFKVKEVDGKINILLTEPVQNRYFFKSLKKARFKEKSLKITLICHDLILFSSSKWFTQAALNKKKLVLASYKIADSIFCVSEYTKQQLEIIAINNNISLTKDISVIELGSKFSPTYSKSVNSYKTGQVTNILYVSSIQPRKNHQRLIRVLQNVASEICPVGLTLIAGESWGDEKISSEIANNSNLNLQIRVLKRVSEKELIEEYRKSDFTCYVSFEEGFGLPILESLALQRPVIASDTSSMKKFATLPGVVMVDPNSEQSLYDAFFLLLSDRAKIIALREEIDPTSIRIMDDFADTLLASLRLE